MKTPQSLAEEIAAKIASGDSESSTVQLLNKGVHAIGKKLIEEAGESWIAAEYQSNEELAGELSQLLYYIVVMAQARGVSIEEIYNKL
jgi:phosphoribosyl-ATP pyrophosphohydrolase